MRGRLADVNVQGHSQVVRRLLETLDLWSILVESAIEFATFTDLGIPENLDDRSLWNYCQREEWVLFTENRNEDGIDSLQTAIADSWTNGHLPVLTLANKRRFSQDADYAKTVAADVAELLYGMTIGEYRNQPRIYIPRSIHPLR